MPRPAMSRLRSVGSATRSRSSARPAGRPRMPPLPLICSTASTAPGSRRCPPLQTGCRHSGSAVERQPSPKPAARCPSRRMAAAPRNLPDVGDQAGDMSLPNASNRPAPASTARQLRGRDPFRLSVVDAGGPLDTSASRRRALEPRGVAVSALERRAPKRRSKLTLL